MWLGRSAVAARLAAADLAEDRDRALQRAFPGQARLDRAEELGRQPAAGTCAIHHWKGAAARIELDPARYPAASWPEKG